MKKCFLCLPVLLWGYIEVVPDYEGYVDVLFPTTIEAYGNLGTWGKIQYVLREKGIEIRGTALKGDGELIVILNVPYYVGLSRLYELPFEKKMLVVYEPPTVEPLLHDPDYYTQFSKVLTWDDDLVDGEQFLKMHYPVMYSMQQNLPSFEERGFLCMITRNKQSTGKDEIYSERRRAIEFFDDLECFDLYGYGWEDEGYTSYRGSLSDKYATLKKYRFSLCYENTQNIRGYVTEKIFDCFHVGTLPIYLGASNILDYVPKECFIDMRDFGSYEALFEYLKEMPEDVFLTYQENIGSFLKTDQAKLFDEETFIQLFVSTVCKGLESS